jgi:glycosyltransferase involved in cell wall biosynthesis
MTNRSDSIFRRYYSHEIFQDRYHVNPQDAVDVIIPVIHTNELWESNLLSFYREIPIHTLLIGDGGCIDDSLEVTSKFPRVKILDHRNNKSLGYSIRKMIEEVETEWFIYLHSDVYLPEGWFDAMKAHQAEYDWFGCPMQHTIMVEYQVDYGVRPWAGSQMGRKMAFQQGLNRVDDDYVYRQEDFVFADIVSQAGFKEGRVDDTFHYHQTMYKPSPWSRKVKSVNIDVELSRAEDVRTWTMQVKGIIKYLQPNIPWLVNDVQFGVFHLLELKALDWNKFKHWVATTNTAWLPYISRRMLLRRQLVTFLRASLRRLTK